MWLFSKNKIPVLVQHFRDIGHFGNGITQKEIKVDKYTTLRELVSLKALHIKRKPEQLEIWYKSRILYGDYWDMPVCDIGNQNGLYVVSIYPKGAWEWRLKALQEEAREREEYIQRQKDKLKQKEQDSVSSPMATNYKVVADLIAKNHRPILNCSKCGAPLYNGKCTYCDDTVDLIVGEWRKDLLTKQE